MSDLKEYIEAVKNGTSDELLKKNIEQIEDQYLKRQLEIEKESAERMAAIDKKYNRIQFGIFVGTFAMVVSLICLGQYAEQKQSDYLKSVSCSELINKKLSEVPLRCVKEYTSK